VNIWTHINYIRMRTYEYKWITFVWVHVKICKSHLCVNMWRYLNMLHIWINISTRANDPSHLSCFVHLICEVRNIHNTHCMIIYIHYICMCKYEYICVWIHMCLQTTPHTSFDSLILCVTSIVYIYIHILYRNIIHAHAYRCMHGLSSTLTHTHTNTHGTS